MKCARAGMVTGKKSETRERVKIRRTMNIVKQHLVIAQAGSNDESREMVKKLEERLESLRKEYMRLS